MSKLKTRLLVDGENHTRLILVPRNYTVGEMLDLAKARVRRPDLAFVWVGYDYLCLSDPFEDWHEFSEIFCLTATDEPPNYDSFRGRCSDPSPSESVFPFRIYTTADYDSMVNGEEFNVNLNWDPRQLNDALMPLVQRKVRISDPIMLHLFLPGGIPFLSGKLKDFFSIPEFKEARHAIYVVISKRINDSVLKREYLELCDCRSDDSKLLLSPLYKQSENGYSHIACLLGYLQRHGLKTDLFLRAMCKYTGFAPLIASIYRMSEGLAVHGRDIVCVTASLFCFYCFLIPIDNERPFDYVLRCSCFVVDRVTDNEETCNLPLRRVENNPASGGSVEGYCQSTNQDSTVIIWEGDMGKTFPRSVMEKPKDPAAISLSVSFKPVSSLTLSRDTGATICQGTNGNTLLLISQSQAKASKPTNSVEVMDPLTGKSISWYVGEMAKEIPYANGEGSAVLIDNERVKQITFVCFDESDSMSYNMSGDDCGDGEPARVTIATQYLTSFVSNTDGFRLSCIQGLISFNDKITTRCPLSPLVRDFEAGLKKVVPRGKRHLWDALDKAADELVAFAIDDDKKKRKFFNAKLRILVISDGDDVGSSAKPWQVCEKLWRSEVIVDSVIVSSEDSCKMLSALCHMTGGMSCRPATIEEGLALFEQEAFLSIENRKTKCRYRGAFDEAAMQAQAEKVQFDKTAPNKVIGLANSKIPPATPKNVIFKNRQSTIPDARRRRILRELHYAASVMEPDSKSVNEETGEEVSIYDPELRVYPFRTNMDQWKVFIKGPDGTPYANKWWYIYVTFPETYPMLPPVFRFVSVPYHLNVSSEGRVCLYMLEKGYMANAVVVEMIQRIRELFLLPDESTPIQISRLEQFKSDRAGYNHLARASADQFGKNTVEEWLEGLTVESDVDPNFTVAIDASATPDYLKSGFIAKYIPLVPSGVYDIDELSMPSAHRIRCRINDDAGACYLIDEPRTLLMSSSDPMCAYGILLKEKHVLGPRMKHGKTKAKIDLRTILMQQNRETGAWSSEIFKLATKVLGHVPDIPVVEQLRELTEETITSIRATVLAIAWLRAYFGSHPDAFRAKERRGLEYLRKVSKSTDWKLEIKRSVSAMI